MLYSHSTLAIKFNKCYFIIFIALLIIEISIATFLKQGFIRFTVGDFLAVILLYSLAKSFFAIQPIYIALAVLCISYGIEFLQRTQMLDWLQLEENSVLRIILGSTFSLEDMIAYTFGVAVIYSIDRLTNFF